MKTKITPGSTGRIIALCALCLCTVCSSADWRPVNPGGRRHLPQVFDRSNLMGLGLEAGPGGYYTRECLKRVQNVYEDGVIRTGVYRKDSPDFPRRDRELKSFWEVNLQRSEKIRRRWLSLPPVTFLITLEMTPRYVEMNEEGVEFHKDAVTLLKSEDLDGFFRVCGDRYIQAVEFQARALVYVAYFPAHAAERKRLERLIRKYSGGGAEDKAQLALFSEIGSEIKSFTSVRADTDNPVEPMDFTFSEYHRRNVGYYLGLLAYSLTRSWRGRILNLRFRPWERLSSIKVPNPTAANFNLDMMRQRTRREELAYLEKSVLDFRLRELRTRKLVEDPPEALRLDNQKKVKGETATRKTSRIVQGRGCLLFYEKISRELNWENMRICRHQASFHAREGDIKEIRQCVILTEAIRKLKRRRNCYSRYDWLKLPTIRPGKFALNEVYRPLELGDFRGSLRPPIAPPVRFEGEEIPFDEERRFFDHHQVRGPENELILGTSMDPRGGNYESRCIQSDSVETSSVYDTRDRTVVHNFFPAGLTKVRPLWMRILFFWEKEPLPRTEYRGVYEITGYSRRLKHNFKLTDAAARLLRKKGPAEFFKECGTHYVSQYSHRRGFIYYFSVYQGALETQKSRGEIAASELPDVIRIIDDRVERRKKIKTLDEMSKKALTSCGKDNSRALGEIRLIAYGVSEKVQEHDCLNKITLREFFENRKDLLKVFKDDSRAIPGRLSLTPWSEYLLVNGILRPEDLDPEILIRKRTLRERIYDAFEYFYKEEEKTRDEEKTGPEAADERGDNENIPEKNLIDVVEEKLKNKENKKKGLKKTIKEGRESP